MAQKRSLIKQTIEFLTSMVEQTTYAWFVQGNLNTKSILVDNAVKVVTWIWYWTFFVMSLKNEFFKDWNC